MKFIQKSFKATISSAIKPEKLNDLSVEIYTKQKMKITTKLDKFKIDHNDCNPTSPSFESPAVEFKR